MNADQEPSLAPDQEASTETPPAAGDEASDAGHPHGSGLIESGTTWRGLLGFIVVIVVVTIAAFLPTFRNDFVKWDDDVNLVNNEMIQGLWPKNIEWMFRTTHNGPYQPLSWMTYALDYAIWGLNPVGYHLTSLLLHTAGAVVFFLVARRLLGYIVAVRDDEHPVGRSVAAAVAALIFAVHPLRVESVAWATERRDVLSGLLFFLALLAYLRARAPAVGQQESPGRSLGTTFVLFVAALLSKGTTVVFPIVLLALDVYPLRRLRGGIRAWFARESREVWIEKLPFLIVAVLAGLVAIRGQTQAGALLSLAERDLPSRFAVAFYAPAFYLWKTIVPTKLSPLYEWPVDFSPVAWPILLSVVLVVAITVLVIRFRPVWPAGLTMWLVYLIFLAPILVPFQAGGHLAADRYTYLSCTVWAIFVGALVMTCWVVRGRSLGIAASVLASLAIVGLAGLTFEQTRVWRNTWDMWSHVLKVDPKCWHAYCGLGNELRERKEYDRALEMLNKGLEINDESPELQNSVGRVYTDLGEYAESLPYYRRAITLNERLMAPHFNLGVALLHVGRDEEALESLQRALGIDPTFGQAHYRLGQAHIRLGRTAESASNAAAARQHYERARDHLLMARRQKRDDPQLAETLRQLMNKLESIP